MPQLDLHCDIILLRISNPTLCTLQCMTRAASALFPKECRRMLPSNMLQFNNKEPQLLLRLPTSRACASASGSVLQASARQRSASAPP